MSERADLAFDQRVGANVKELREARGLTQEALAEEAGTTRRTIGSIERGDSTAQRQVLDRVLKVLDLAPEQVDGDVTAYEAPARLQQAVRDALLVLPATKVAELLGVTRARVYQLRDGRR